MYSIYIATRPARSVGGESVAVALDGELTTNEATFGGDFLTWRCSQLCSCPARRGVNCTIFL